MEPDSLLAQFEKMTEKEKNKPVSLSEASAILESLNKEPPEDLIEMKDLPNLGDVTFYEKEAHDSDYQECFKEELQKEITYSDYKINYYPKEYSGEWVAPLYDRLVEKNLMEPFDKKPPREVHRFTDFLKGLDDEES